MLTQWFYMVRSFDPTPQPINLSNDHSFILLYKAKQAFNNPKTLEEFTSLFSQ